MKLAGYVGAQIQSLGFLCGFYNKEPEELGGVDIELMGMAHRSMSAFCRGRAQGHFARMFAVPMHAMSLSARDDLVALHRAIVGI